MSADAAEQPQARKKLAMKKANELAGMKASKLAQ